VQGLGTDAAVHAAPAADVLHSGADIVAQIGHLADEGDLGSEDDLISALVRRLVNRIGLSLRNSRR
jgi:hypothetical protein